MLEKSFEQDAKGELPEDETMRDLTTSDRHESGERAEERDDAGDDAGVAGERATD